MDDNSLRSPNSFDLGSGSNTNNKPPEIPLESGTSSSNKQEIDEDDNTVYSTPNKRHQTDPLSPKEQEKNKENPLYENKVECEIDPVDIEIFCLSYEIWSIEEDEEESYEVDKNYNLPLEDSTDATGDDTNDLSST
ncbi:hypothetical protein Tco_1319722 [Tanacetum coccineum]